MKAFPWTSLFGVAWLMLTFHAANFEPQMLLALSCFNCQPTWYSNVHEPCKQLPLFCFRRNRESLFLTFFLRKEGSGSQSSGPPPLFFWGPFSSKSNSSRGKPMEDGGIGALFSNDSKIIFPSFKKKWKKSMKNIHICNGFAFFC